MRKYECNACGIRICTAEYQDGSGVPFKCTCIVDRYFKPQWKEIVELPKLTTEVFDRPDCLEWAEYASINKNGRVIFYSDKTSPGVKADMGFYDASDWQNSLVERHPQFPDWAEVGGYVYDDRNGYGKIVSGSVKSCYIEFDGGAGDFVPEAFAKLKPARLRPYNAEEMKELVGKIICEANASHVATTCIHHDGTDYLRLGIHLYDAEELISKGFTIDGNPCAILEHLEEGEWVK